MNALGNALGDVIVFIIDKLTDKVADYIKFKEIENRVKIHNWSKKTKIFFYLDILEISPPTGRYWKGEKRWN